MTDAREKELGSPEQVAGLIEGDVRAHRDPALWFVCATDPDGTPRIWSKGATQQEARANADRGVRQFLGTKSGPMTEVQAWRLETIGPDD